MTYEDEYVLSSVLLKYWDSYCMQVIKFAIDVDSNTIIEVGFAELSRGIVR